MTKLATISPTKIAQSNPHVDLEILKKALREAKDNQIQPKKRSNGNRIPYISKNSHEGSWSNI